MDYKISDIPKIPADNFRLGNSYKMTGVYFHCAIKDDVLSHYAYGWEPVGKTTESRLISKNSNMAIIFENKVGERTWFHFFVEEV